MKAEIIKVEKNYWELKFENDIIKIENKTNELRLYVNDKLQDIFLGLGTSHNIRFYGKTTKNKSIKIVFGGDFKVHCFVFVDNELIYND